MGFDFWLECTDTDVLNYKRMVMDNPKLNNEFINKIFTAFAKVNNYIRIKILHKFDLPHLGIIVTSYCSLNCEKCSNLIPYRSKHHYAFKDIKKDLNKILKTVDQIHEIQLVGGEIFVYPEFVEVLDYCLKQKKIKYIVITTNGTIFPTEKLKNILRADEAKRKVSIQVSNYRKLAPRRREIIDQLRDCGIPVDQQDNQKYWSDMGMFESRNRTVKELEIIFKACLSKNCVHMMDGIITLCGRQLGSLDYDGIPTTLPSECVDVRNAKNKIQLRKDIISFLNQTYISTCNYCDGHTIYAPKIPIAVQMGTKR